MLGSVFAFVAQPRHALSQQQSINGSIRGTITDPSGAPVPNVTVTVLNLNTGFTRQVVTASDGVYVAANLPIGTYSVATAATGFAAYSQSGIHLDAGSDLTVNQALKVGGVATEVQVTADAPIIETARFDLGRTISADETENLPLTSRNPYNFILFQPGVSGHPNTENGIPNTLNTNDFGFLCAGSPDHLQQLRARIRRHRRHHLQRHHRLGNQPSPRRSAVHMAP
jgi:hypothetical protein